MSLTLGLMIGDMWNVHIVRRRLNLETMTFSGRLGPRGLLRKLFLEEFPNGDLYKFEKILSKYKDEEIMRVVDGAMRFGLAAMLDVIDWKEHKRV